jgi:hypothetical protein
MIVDAFLSYARSDRDTVVAIHDALDARGLDVWMDERRLAPDVDWLDGVDAGIRSARAVVVAVTPRSQQSEACQLEIAMARDQEKPLFALIVEPAEPPFDAQVVESIDELAGLLR